jgi:hypothetical protein
MISSGDPTYILGWTKDHTWDEKYRPTDNDQIVFPANIVEAHRSGLQENDSGFVMLADSQKFIEKAINSPAN